MKTTKEMKKAIENMLKLYEESERLEEIDEAASDKAYEEAHALCMEITETIVKVTRGMIDKATARVMVLKTPEKLIAICEKF
jgi:esterase/lipase